MSGRDLPITQNRLMFGSSYARQQYRVYKKKLNRFEIALNFAKQLFVSGFLYI